jgi:3-phenylpropionate/trans-cinnamate dioxygenase ferredoxin reductase subunit
MVDETMATASPEVVAVGDCVSFPHWELKRRVRLESVQNAVDQAKTAAKTLLCRPEPYHEVPWFWSDQGDVKLQMVGLPFGTTQAVVRGKVEDNRFSVFHFAGENLRRRERRPEGAGAEGHRRRVRRRRRRPT